MKLLIAIAHFFDAGGDRYYGSPGPPAAPPAGPWRDRLKALLTGYGEVLRARPEIARMALSTQPGGPNYVALVDAVLGLLLDGHRFTFTAV